MGSKESNPCLGPLNSSQKELAWYAVYTRPRAEKMVLKRIEELGIEAFLPLQKTLRQWSDRKKVVEKPLLTSYLFVHTKPKCFPAVYKVYGFVRLVSFEGQPVTIPAQQIDNLKLIVNSDTPVEVTGELPEQGDTVEVTTGSLAGLKGELIGKGRKKKVVVRLDKLEKNICITVPVTYLKVIGKA
jgi:transcription antitermination factor NusG